MTKARFFLQRAELRQRGRACEPVRKMAAPWAPSHLLRARWGWGGCCFPGETEGRLLKEPRLSQPGYLLPFCTLVPHFAYNDAGAKSWRPHWSVD